MTREDKDSLVEMLAKIPVTETKGSLLSAIGNLLRVIDISESSIMIPTLLKDKCEFDAYEMLTLAKILKASILGHNDLVEFYLSESSSQFPNDHLAHHKRQSRPQSQPLHQQQQLMITGTTSTTAIAHNHNSSLINNNNNNISINNNVNHHGAAQGPQGHHRDHHYSSTHTGSTNTSSNSSSGHFSQHHAGAYLMSATSHHLSSNPIHQLSATPSLRSSSVSDSTASSTAPSTPMPHLAESIGSGSGSQGDAGKHLLSSNQLHRLQLGPNGDPDATVRLLLQIEHLKVFIPHVTGIFESIVELYKNSVDTFT